MIKVKTIHHVNVPSREDKLQEMHNFYANVLGMSDLDRPNMQISRPGLWLHYGDRELHVSTGTDRSPHVAIEVEDYEDAKRILTENGIKWEESLNIGKQIFIRDPEGNAIEIRPAE